jgi:thiol-disulfide isomerase/thioredoxin
MKKIILLLLCILTFMLAAFAGESFNAFEGNSVSYDTIISAQKTILFIWTGGCPYCIRALRYLNENKDLSGSAKFYFINAGERRSDIAHIVKALKLKSHITDAIILDPQAYFAENFSVIGVPTVIFLRNGKEVKRSYYIDRNIIKEVFGK